MQMWTLECMYLFKLVFLFFFQTYTQEWKSLGHVTALFLFFWEISVVFSILPAPIYILKKCKRIPISLYPCQHLLFVFFLSIAILTGVWWCLCMVLIYISLMIRDIEHLFMCLWTNCMSCPLWRTDYLHVKELN